MCSNPNSSSCLKICNHFPFLSTSVLLFLFCLFFFFFKISGEIIISPNKRSTLRIGLCSSYSNYTQRYFIPTRFIYTQLQTYLKRTVLLIVLTLPPTLKYMGDLKHLCMSEMCVLLWIQWQEMGTWKATAARSMKWWLPEPMSTWVIAIYINDLLTQISSVAMQGLLYVAMHATTFPHFPWYMYGNKSSKSALHGLGVFTGQNWRRE